MHVNFIRKKILFIDGDIRKALIQTETSGYHHEYRMENIAGHRVHNTLQIIMTRICEWKGNGNGNGNGNSVMIF